MIVPFASVRPRAAVTALAVTAALAAFGAGPAEAAPSGSATIVSTGPAAEQLRSAGVRIEPLPAAKGGARRARLEVSTGLAGAETTLLRLRGGLALGKGDKRVRLTGLTLLLGKRSRVTARLGGRQLNLWKIGRGGSREVDPGAGSVRLSGLRLKLTRGAARAISAALAVDPPTRRAFGTLSARAFGLAAAGTPPESKAEAAAEGCPAPSGAGPEPESPLPVATRPPAAVDITSATLTWHVRESFIRYINSGEGTSVSGGATADPPVQLEGASAALSYSFRFPFAEGWRDDGGTPADPADDRAAIYYGGAVRFLYSGHGIDLSTASPEIEIAGAGSRAIFAISEAGGPAERQVLVNLDLGRAASIAVSANTVTYDRVPAAIPSGTASSVFAGFYSPGTEFGCVSVAYTTS